MGNSQHKSRVTLDDSDEENELHEEEQEQEQDQEQEQNNITHEIEEQVDPEIQEKEARFKEVNNAFNVLLIYLKIANQRKMFTEDECRKINDCVNRFV